MTSEHTPKKRVVCFHLFNDFSGSPKVLQLSLRGLLEQGYSVDLYSTRGGVLDVLDAYPHFHLHTYRYQFSLRQWLTLLRYLRVQVYTFFAALRYFRQKDVVFYINTLLPVGPALAGRLMGKRVVYHYHENAKAKGLVYETLCAAMLRLSHKTICVSAYQCSFLSRQERTVVVSNCLPNDFVARLRPDIAAAFARKQVLMLGSLKAYKGVGEFVTLARALPSYRFTLVLNESQRRIDSYFASQTLPSNLTVYPRQADVVPFYNDASVVLNLSNPALFVETFGLTALEAMSCALPVVVPPVGGIAEIVEDGVSGFLRDVRQLPAIEQLLTQLLTDAALYTRIAQAALARSAHYDYQHFTQRIASLLFA